MAKKKTIWWIEALQALSFVLFMMGAIWAMGWAFDKAVLEKDCYVRTVLVDSDNYQIIRTDDIKCPK